MGGDGYNKSIMETPDEKTRRWFYYGYNRDETILALMEKLNEREDRIRALEKELREVKDTGAAYGGV